jgi:class 3 adenylate cyclase
MHDGGIVKTIGDAVMAAFPDPAQAVRAALAVQRSVARFNRERRSSPTAW